MSVFAVVATRPVPVFIVAGPRKQLHSDELDSAELVRALAEDFGEESLFRCVDLEWLGDVLTNGAGPAPDDTLMWCDSWPSALPEFGDSLGVVLAYRQSSLARSWLQLPSSTRLADVDVLRSIYPNVATLEDGSFWLSRLPSTDSRWGPEADESEQGYWIPGEPFDALQAVFLVGGEMDVLRAYAARAFATCLTRTWTLNDDDLRRMDEQLFGSS